MIDKESNAVVNSKRTLLVLAVLYLAFVIYGSLVPLRMVPIPLDQAIARFGQIPFLELGIGSRADWVANLLLFVPLSMLWGQILLPPPGSRSRLVVAPAIVAACMALALAIEFTQIFFPQRTVSQNDILAESLGGILGLAALALWGNRLERLVGALWRKESQVGRLTRLLHVYLVGMLLFNILPLDLTISPVEIYHKWKEGKVVLLPFAGLRGTQAFNLYESLTDVIVWVPCGLLWMLTRRPSIARTAIYGIAAGFAIEAAQLFVYSRVTDVTDILLAMVGSALGASISQAIGRQRVFTSMPGPRLWFGLWVAWLVGVFGIFWFPFDFSAVDKSPFEALAGIFRIPFVTYYFGSEFHAVNELLRKVGFFLPGGILWGMAVAARKQDASSHGAVSAGMIGIALAAFAIEAGQALLPQKIGDITDVCLEFFGGAMGLLVVLWVMKGASEPLPASGGDIPPAASTSHPQRREEAEELAPSAQPEPGRPPAAPARAWTDAPALAAAIVGAVALLRTDFFTALPLLWQTLSLGALLLAALSARIPHITLVAYALVAYGLPRYTDHYLSLMNSGVLTWIAATGALGSLTWLHRQADSPRRLKDPLFMVMLIFFAWLFAAWLKSTLDHSLYVADQRHHPVLFLHALLLFLIAALPAPRGQILRVGIVALIMTPLLRWTMQGHEAIYLDGDLPVIAAILLPFAILGARFAKSMAGKAGYALTALVLVALIAFAQNRGAGVALVVGLLFLLRHHRRKYTALTVAGAVMALAVVFLPVDTYLARYSVLWNPQAKHATANLDRSTINERLELWESGVEMAMDHPFLGVGPSNYANTIVFYRIGKDNLVAHNSLLSLAAEAGLVSVVLYLAALLMAFVRTERIARISDPPAAASAVAIQVALVTQFAAGMFISRHDLVLQYALIGMVVSLAAASNLFTTRK